MKKYAFVALVLVAAFVVSNMTATAAGERSFKDELGPVTVGAVRAQGGAYQVPFIVWGGDVATFLANGGLTTRQGTLFAERGLNLKLVPGDAFLPQVRDYMSGASPFLRGTVHMIYLATEVLNSDPRTKPVMLFQMTWSGGDHMVARENVRTVADLRGKTVVLQKFGPHVGLVDDILQTGQLTWNDVTIVWADDLTGTDNSPAAIFRNNPNVAACCVITPDMLGLTGGLQQSGTGAETTIKGAKVLVSTADSLSRSIADVYVVRKDFYDANTDLVKKFTAGYLKATEKLLAIKREYEAKGNDEYTALLRTAQQIYGEAVLPTIDEDAHGLVLDSRFVGYPGNVEFFTNAANLSRFEVLEKRALDLAVGRGYSRVRAGVMKPTWDWNDSVLTGSLATTQVQRVERFRAEALENEIEALNSGELDQRTIYSFAINFEPNQTSFSETQYGVEFQRVVELANQYGSAAIAVRGHADPTNTLLELVKAGLDTGVLERRGTSGNYVYILKSTGQTLDLSSTQQLIQLIESGAIDRSSQHNPRETMQAALNLSRRRSEQVRAAIVQYAAGRGLQLDLSQIQPVGVGIREPIVPKPGNMAEAQRNMRVEFRLVRVTAEAQTQSDFDF